jgi:hypothetical protein
MRNITMNTKNNILTVEIDLSKTLGPSKSGKTMLVATTEGNKPVEGADDVKIGINCYKPL